MGWKELVNHMNDLQKDIEFTIELISEYPESNFLGIEYYLCMLNFESLTKEQDQLLVDAIRANPLIRSEVNQKQVAGTFCATRDRAFMDPATWEPDTETV